MQKDDHLSPDYCIRFAKGGFSDRIAGLIFGHAIGDAVGLCTEYKEKKNICGVEFPYITSIRGVPVNDWTDDTDLMIITMISLIEQNMSFEPSDIAGRFNYWIKHGLTFCNDTTPTTPNGVFKHIVNKPEYIEDPFGVATAAFNAAKGSLSCNTPLSRISILGTLSNSPDFAENFCRITHVDSRCVASCVFTTCLINQLIYNWLLTASRIDEYVANAAETARKYIDSTHLQEFNDVITHGYSDCISSFHLDELSKMGRVFKCLSCVVYAAHIVKVALEHKKMPDYKKVILKISSEGGDADANAAVVGAIIGAFVGYKNLPQDWVEAMPHSRQLNRFSAYFISRLLMPTSIDENKSANDAAMASENDDNVVGGISEGSDTVTTNAVNTDVVNTDVVNTDTVTIADAFDEVASDL